MLKRISIIAFSLLATSGVASATIAEDRNLLNLLNNGLEAVCSDSESQACLNFKNRIVDVSNRIAEQEAAAPQTAQRSVVILVNEAKKIVSGDNVVASLDTIATNSNGEMVGVIRVVEGVELFKSIGLICPVANSFPAILSKVISASVSVDDRLSTLIIGELATCKPERLAFAAKTIITAAGTTAPGVLQQIQLLAPNFVDEVIGYIADANLPPEVQQAVANVINETPTAANVGTDASSG